MTFEEWWKGYTGSDKDKSLVMGKVYAQSAWDYQQARIEVLREPLMAARSLAMKNTMAARIPECGDFGAIAQDLDYVCSQLFPEPPEQEGE